MDDRLVAWGRQVKRRAGGLPTLWLFTDARRLPDPLPAVRRLPLGAGVVFRHDGLAGRGELGRRLAAACRERRLVLVVAGDWRLAMALGAGLHLRAGRWPGRGQRGGLITSSAHSMAELARARRAGARLAFLSPAFATASHPGAEALGAARWAGMARRAGLSVAALGGVDGRRVRRLGPDCVAAGAIGALA
jgi:thiamine-phosphate pyrophosphorylase